MEVRRPERVYRSRSRIQGFQGPPATAGRRLLPFFVLLTVDWEDRGVARLADPPGGPGIQVRLLGPFEVVREDVAQRLPGRGERALLALLALSAGRVVAATSLVGQLWSPADQPDDPIGSDLTVDQFVTILASLARFNVAVQVDQVSYLVVQPAIALARVLQKRLAALR